MNKLHIDWEGCYGIRKLDHEFNFQGRNHTQLIYAPNGTMKSSFANTFKVIGQNKRNSQPEDRIRQEKSQRYIVKVDGQPIDPSTILVVDAEDKSIDASSKFSSFLASKELRDRYNNILQILNEKKGELLAKLSTVAQSSDCEAEILEAFGENQVTTIFKCLDDIYPHLSSDKNVYTFKYNNIFDKKGDVEGFLKEHTEELQDYFDRYKELLSNSQLFRRNGNFIFGTKGVANLNSMLKDGNFFGVEHTIQLNGGKTIKTKEEFDQLIKDDKASILSDKELTKKFDKITKDIDSNANLRLFKAEIEKDPSLIGKLINYEGFRKEVWYSYMSSPDVFPYATALHDIYKEKKEELQQILVDAGKEQERWKQIITLFSERFFVPFRVEIENQQDVILKADAAKLSFLYKDDGQYYKEDRGTLVNILSKGEQRAFYILQILFEIEALKGNGKDNLIIFDDIADSFDYQNKYAIIEYLYDLHRDTSTNFYLIVLTHNFDFYRTVASRCGLGRNQVWMAIRDLHGNVELKQGQYRKDLFSYMMANVNNNKFFISLIPFVRNLVEYEKGTSDAEYMLLTKCMHLIDERNPVLDEQVLPILSRYSHGNTFNRTSSHLKVFDIIFHEADSIETEANLDPVAIENKIVLSIACRLKAEMFLKHAILTHGGSEADLACSSNQFKHWMDTYQSLIPNDEHGNIVEEVNMMTPEFIHVNSFMYEPLIDMSVDHLKDLYNRCKTLPC